MLPSKESSYAFISLGAKKHDGKMDGKPSPSRDCHKPSAPKRTDGKKSDKDNKSGDKDNKSGDNSGKAHDSGSRRRKRIRSEERQDDLFKPDKVKR